jgi:hypothetical protein
MVLLVIKNAPNVKFGSINQKPKKNLVNTPSMVHHQAFSPSCHSKFWIPPPTWRPFSFHAPETYKANR